MRVARTRYLHVARPVAGLVAAAAFVWTSNAFAQATPLGTPPAEGKALVQAPKPIADEPAIEVPTDGTNVSISAGGMLATGNSRLLAFSGNGVYETRFNANAIGASVLGNYGQSAPPGEAVRVSAENIQGRVRYDRYVIEQASLFLINTGRHDRFQGLELRYNLDPGFKYIFHKRADGSLWGEAGYDLQHDVRRDDGRIVLDDKKVPVPGAALLPKTKTDHSTRLFAGFKHAFNKEVTFVSGVEYLQSFLDSARYRLNFDALIAANVGAGLSLGFGFSARYDHDPLPGKEKLDTASTVSLIFAFDNVAAPPKATCPCPEETPAAPPPPPSTDAPAEAPPTDTPPAADAPASAPPPPTP